MIYLLETKERCVYGFASEAAGVAYAEGVDVAAGLWQFFDEEGRPLVARFTAPNHVGRFTSGSGAYRLEPAPPGAARLQDVLHELRAVVIDGKRLTAAALRERLPTPGPA